ncbi:AraC family transcriptional regulator [Sinomonas humi]|uniref:AraC family transcriptional regulator n=1 Tax=Sinomonas humi TaxID=1338436 RepID=UPI00068C3CE2|nr:AraC family transcriptional regulator [Sinomonas humi]
MDPLDDAALQPGFVGADPEHDRLVGQKSGLVSLRGRDAELVRRQTSAAFSEVDMQFAGVNDLDFQLDLARSSRLTLGRMGYGDAATVFGPPMEDWYHINVPMTGESRAEQNGRRGALTAGRAAIMFRPGEPLKVTMSARSWQYHVKIPKRLLEARAAKMAGLPTGEPIDFDLTFDLTDGMGPTLLSAVRFLYEECSRPQGLSAVPLACQEFESAFLTQILMTVPSQLIRIVARPPERVRRSRVRDVFEYIDANADREITTADLAQIAGCSIRSLQAEFRESVGISPTAYLRGVRLDRVHADLLAGGAVTAVAAKWGFYHFGRFAGHYRERFGVTPSETARGTR